MYQLKQRKMFNIVPLFFPDVLQSSWERTHVEPMFYDESGEWIPTCSREDTHSWFTTKADKRIRCFWCRSYFDDLYGKKIMDLGDIGGVLGSSDLPLLVVPELDFDSPTTATVNVPHNDLSSDPVMQDHLKYVMPEVSRVESYCLRCKVKTLILDPVHYDQESARGVRRYVKGKCSVCGSKINAIVKRGD